MRTWREMRNEKAQIAGSIRPKVVMLTSGKDCSVVPMKRGNARGGRGVGYSLRHHATTQRWEESLGSAGNRQVATGDTSRMTGDCHVRICEGSRVKLPRSTRQPSEDAS